jgi:glyoxylase-like metal-dependent hydrolase (beta-lactamase superfamily II)
LHPDEHVLWRLAHPDTPPPDAELAHGAVLHVAGTALRVLHTPGHSPGSCCLYAPDLNVVFSGDTLFQGGPGATGRSYSDFDEIIVSIRTRLLTLPAETEVRTGHGDSTTIGNEAEHVGEWIA